MEKFDLESLVIFINKSFDFKDFAMIVLRLAFYVIKKKLKRRQEIDYGIQIRLIGKMRFRKKYRIRK